MNCPTVRIKSSNPEVPFIVINEEDFDAEKHELYVEEDFDAEKHELYVEEAPVEAPAAKPSSKATK